MSNEGRCRGVLLGCDDDIECCLENNSDPKHILSSTPVSMSCLARDLQDGIPIHEAFIKNDRYIYLMVVIVAFLVVAMVFTRRAPSDLYYPAR